MHVQYSARRFKALRSGYTSEGLMENYTDEQLRDLLELWGHNSQGLSEAHMTALAAWAQTPEETRARITAMIKARQTGVAPQRATATEEAFMQEHGLGAEPEPSKPPRTRKLFGRNRD